LAVLFVCTLLFDPLSVYAEDDELILGVFPRRSAMHTVSAFTPLANYLASKIEQPVSIETAADFDSFWDEVSRQRYDIVHYNQYHYIRSHKALGYQVIAMNEEFGRSQISATVMVRRDSGIKTVADLRGKKIVFGGGPHAMLSYIMPSLLLSQAGLRQGEYQAEFARHPGNAALAVCVKQADAAGTSDIALDMPVVSNRCDTSTLSQLLKGKPLAQLPWAVKGSLRAELHERIQQVLISAKQYADGRAALASAELTGLLPAVDHDYDEYRAIVREALDERY